MTLTKQKLTREAGRRTRLRNTDVARVLEALMDMVIEEIAQGGRVEFENFLVLEVQTRTRYTGVDRQPFTSRILKARPGKRLRHALKDGKYLTNRG